MIFTLAIILGGLAVWLGLRKPSSTSGLLDRLLEVLFPIAGCVATVTILFAFLSIPFVNRDLSQDSIAQLRALEQQIPAWAVAFSDLLPKWYVNAALALLGLGISIYQFRASPSVLVGLRRQQRVIARLRQAGNLATGAACGLFAAAAITLFGDALADTARDVRQEILSAEIRFEKGTVAFVRELSAEIVTAALNEIREVKSSQTPSWSATIAAIRAVRSGLILQTSLLRAEDDSSGNPAAVLYALAELDSLRGTVPGGDTKREEVRRAISEEVIRRSRGVELRSDLAIREEMNSRSIREVMPDVEVSAGQRNERRELNKELIASFADRLKASAEGDPLFVLFAEAGVPFLTEVLASFTSRAVLEPLLSRLWKSEDRKSASQILEQEVKAAVKKVNAQQIWDQMSTSSFAAKVSSLIEIGEILHVSSLDGQWQPDPDDMRQIVELLRQMGRMKDIGKLESSLEHGNAEDFLHVLRVSLSEITPNAVQDEVLAHKLFSPPDPVSESDIRVLLAFLRANNPTLHNQLFKPSLNSNDSKVGIKPIDTTAGRKPFVPNNRHFKWFRFK